MSSMGWRETMGFFLLEPQIILIDWTRDWRLDLAALIANSTSSLGFLRVPPDVPFFTSLFDDPNKAARVLYAQYWQRKLKDNDEVSFPDSLVTEIAEETDRFSFAYLKEALYAFPTIASC
jgi:hypothetical protein